MVTCNTRVLKNTVFSLVVEYLFPFPVFVNEMEHYLVLAVVVLFFSISNICQTIYCGNRTQKSTEKKVDIYVIIIHSKNKSGEVDIDVIISSLEEQKRADIYGILT